MNAPVMVNVALSERRAKPSHEGSSTRVRGQGGSSLSVTLGEAEEFGVERISEVFAE
jgi:hypothetical protein